ncbi:MAG TPA: HNH endonuclease family protein [Candidatus Saccharimonadales bacterium]|jgi:hypothetical protein|nr:HNH endonuclease family protein [Candidatus Saccharimonadales bacterium]
MDVIAKKKRRKRFGFVLTLAIVMSIGIFSTTHQPSPNDDSTANLPPASHSPAAEILKTLPIKGRAPKTGYTRTQFTNGWNKSGGCDTRNRILQQDLTNITYAKTTGVTVCEVASGTLHDPYTGKTIQFTRGAETSSAIQIDHVVAISDAWQKGAQQLTYSVRNQLANDPLELLAVDGPANQQKGDGDAATWLPPNKAYRCAYVARQIAVKKKYSLWVTRSEYDAISTILSSCPQQTLPT